MEASIPELTPSDAIIIVDVQNDFCPGGALAVERGDEVVPVLNEWIRAATAAGASVIASRDWHPKDHVSFNAGGGPWPSHCVQNTYGSEFHSRLELPDDVDIVSKGYDPEEDAYSAFQGTQLDRHLEENGVDRLFVGGLALDYCVRATVLDGLKAGFEVHLIPDGSKPVDVKPGDGERAVQEMRDAGAVIG